MDKIYDSGLTEKQEIGYARILGAIPGNEWQIQTYSHPLIYGFIFTINDKVIAGIYRVTSRILWEMTKYKVVLGPINTTTIGSTRKVRAQIKKLFDEIELFNTKQKSDLRTSELKKVRTILKAYFQSLENK